jgi:2'-5' RNA ligase
MAEKRLFVAVSLSADAVAALAELARAGDAAAEGNNVRWLPQENLHVTLHFIGDTPEERVGDAEAALEGLPGREAIDLKLNHVGTFPNPKRPRVLWAGFDEGTEALRALAGHVSGALVDAGFPEPDKPFRAHVTLGYVRKQTAPAVARRIFERIAETAPEVLGSGVWSRITECMLIESIRRPQGAEHTVRRRFGFNPDADA